MDILYAATCLMKKPSNPDRWSNGWPVSHPSGIARLVLALCVIAAGAGALDYAARVSTPGPLVAAAVQSGAGER